MSMKTSIRSLVCLVVWLVWAQQVQSKQTLNSKILKLQPIQSTDPSNSQLSRPHLSVRGGFSFFPQGYWGYRITPLGERFLSSEGARECDLGRFLASLLSTKNGSKKTTAEIKSQWLELVRFSKTGEASRIYRTLNELLTLLVDAKFIE